MKRWNKLAAGLLLTMLLASSCTGLFAKYSWEQEEAARQTQMFNESDER